MMRADLGADLEAPARGATQHDLGRLARQTRHELVSLARTPITMILAVGFPVLFFTLLGSLVGDVVVDGEGTRLVQFLAPGLAAYGLAMAAFSFLAFGLAQDRAAGVVKRQSVTPAPGWVLIGGRIAASSILGAVAVALVLVIGAAVFDLRVPAHRWLALVVAVLLGAATFSACGLALALAMPNPQSVMAVANGIVIPLGFVSDVFMASTTMPAWLRTVGDVFPLKRVVTGLKAGLDPHGDGALPLGDLAVVAVWGVLGAALCVWLLRRASDSARRPTRRPSETPERDRRPVNASAPSPARLLLGQAWHAQAVVWRNPSAVFFAVLFPVVLTVVIPTVNGGAATRTESGQTLGVVYAATMAVYGAAVTAYVNIPQNLAETRESGALRRTRATPLPMWALVAGHVVAALVVAVVTLALIVVVAWSLDRDASVARWGVALLIIVVATACFAVLGLVVASLVRSAQAAVGVALGTLLPICFVSDVFVVGVAYPAVLEWLSWVFPVRHAVRAVTDATVAGTGFPVGHLSVIGAWLVAGSALLVARLVRQADD